MESLFKCETGAEYADAMSALACVMRRKLYLIGKDDVNQLQGALQG